MSSNFSVVDSEFTLTSDNLPVLSAAEADEVFKPYQFKMEEIEGLRYRSKVGTHWRMSHLAYSVVRQL